MVVYLISEQTIKDTTVLNENVDPKLIAPAILESQDIHIQSILGSNLFNKITTLVGNKSISGTTNADYKLLLDSYITPALKYYVLAELVLPMTIKLMNKSIATRTSEFSNSIQIDDMALVRENFMNKAEYYGERLINYLKDNTTTYPEYLLSTGTALFSTIIPKRSSYTSGMYLGDEDMREGFGFDYPRK